MKTTSFTNPEIFDFTELQEGNHPHFKTYLIDNKGNGYGFEPQNSLGDHVLIDPNFKTFLESQISGKILAVSSEGDFSITIKVDHSKDIFEENLKYYYVSEQDGGHALSKYIKHVYREAEKIDGLHEESAY